MKHILVWDLPVRVFHWTLALLVPASVATAMIGGNWMNWHGRFGVLIAGLLAFRIVWGFVGSSTARFTGFVRGPRAIADYLKGRWHGIGHNPLGALSVIGLLAVLAMQVSTGLVSNDDIAFNGPLYALVSKETSDWIAGLHKTNAWLLGLLVTLHLGAIAFYMRVKKENLITPMIVGTRAVDDAQLEPARGGTLPALILAIGIGVAAAWAAGGGLLPTPPEPVAPTANW